MCFVINNESDITELSRRKQVVLYIFSICAGCVEYVSVSAIISFYILRKNICQ